MNTPDYIKQFREEYKKAYKGIFSDEVLEKGNEWYESFLTEVYEQGRRDERERIEVRLDDYFKGLILMPYPQGSLPLLKEFLKVEPPNKEK